MSNSSYVLRAEGIGRSFGRTDVLKSAGLWVESGKVTTLMGRNGSGKTTLLRIAVGVLRADYGVVSFRGVASERQALPRMARRGLMYVPQEGLAAPAFAVRDHFQALAAIFGSSGVEEAVSLADLGDLMDQRVGDLSGGERSRVSIGLALARKPEVLVMDEPLVGLAPRTQEQVGELLRAVALRGAAVVTSGHDAPALFQISDIIIWSVAGTTHHLGTPAEAREHAQFRQEYLGPNFDPDEWFGEAAT